MKQTEWKLENGNPYVYRCLLRRFRHSFAASPAKAIPAIVPAIHPKKSKQEFRIDYSTQQQESSRSHEESRRILLDLSDLEEAPLRLQGDQPTLTPHPPPSLASLLDRE